MTIEQWRRAVPPNYSGSYSLLLVTGDRFRIEIPGHAILHEPESLLMIMTGLVSYAFCDLAAIAAVEFGDHLSGSNGRNRLSAL